MKWNMIGQSFMQLAVLIWVFEYGAGPICDCAMDPDVECTAENCPHCKRKGKDCPNCGGFFDIPTGILRKDASSNPTQHLTIVFNAFVQFQLFNWLNCRKLNHEPFVLAGVQNNGTFCIIWVICFVIQFFLVEFGIFSIYLGVGVDVHHFSFNYGAPHFGLKDESLWECDANNLAVVTASLTREQWIYCILMGLVSMPWQWVIIVVGAIVNPGMTDQSVIHLTHKGEKYEDEEAKGEHEKDHVHVKEARRLSATAKVSPEADVDGSPKNEKMGAESAAQIDAGVHHHEQP
jgi:hypothetical protein